MAADDDLMRRLPSRSDEMLRELFSEAWSILNELHTIRRELRALNRVESLVTGTPYQPGLLDVTECLVDQLKQLNRQIAGLDNRICNRVSTAMTDTLAGSLRVLGDTTIELSELCRELDVRSQALESNLRKRRFEMLFLGALLLLGGVALGKFL